MNATSSIKAFESQEKRLPRDWKEISDVWQRPLDQIFPDVLPTVRYEYFNPPLILRFHPQRSIEVLAVTRKAMTETTRKESVFGRVAALKDPGRYLIRRESGGDWGTQWLDEAAIQRFWPSTGRSLPTPDTEPERKWIAAARHQILLRRIAVSLVAALIVVRIAFHVRGRRARAVG